MANTAEATFAPSQLGRYELITPLGEGGMAQVYLAMQRGSVANKLVVIKLLREQFSSDDQFIAMFADESRIAVRLSHPNVIHTYEASTTGAKHYIVMEFLEAKTLSQLLRRMGRKNMPLETHLWVICEVLSGLAYAHRLVDFDGAPLQIVHRDVSPSNVLCTTRGEVKLVDFGIAKVVGAIAHTQHGVIKGKLGYASPEQCLGNHADGRADIYAVGVMLWEALTGERRAIGESAIATIRTRAQESKLDIADVFPSVSPRLAAMTRRALAADPAERYPSAHELELELRQYLREAGAPNGATQLQALVSEYFGGEFAAVRAIIDQRVRPAAPGRLSEAPSSKPVELTATHPASTPAVNLIAPDSPSPFASRTSRLRRALLPVAVAALVGLAAVVYFGGGVPARNVAASANAQPTAAAVLSDSLPAPALDSPPSPAPDSGVPVVRLRIRALPAGVRLRLDGVAQRNPLQTAVPRDGKDHELLAEANGYIRERRIVRFDSDQDLQLSLAAQRSITGRVAAPAAAVAAPPVRSRAPTKIDAAEPGTDLRKQAPPAAGRALDERDPYAP